MIFVIGDVHGEITKLKKLIKQIKQYKINRLIFIGDYLDKGENSKQTLNYLIHLSKKYKCDFLMGNHERNWLDCKINNLKKYGGVSTLQDFGLKKFDKKNIDKKILKPYASFFKKLINSIEIKNYSISHAGFGSRYEFIQYLPPNKKKIFIFGHTGFVTPFYDGYKIGIDTGAAYFPKAPLTAFELTSKFFINHFGKKTKLKDIALNKCPTIIRHNLF